MEQLNELAASPSAGTRPKSPEPAEMEEQEYPMVVAAWPEATPLEFTVKVAEPHELGLDTVVGCWGKVAGIDQEVAYLGVVDSVGGESGTGHWCGWCAPTRRKARDWHRSRETRCWSATAKMSSGRCASRARRGGFPWD